ncbi:ARID DNA-binding domain-containing protein [Tanacetum coccineum]|uniref:ARID DNA-binding domain-containing protein n=1 Tax=Tanacetum coccineum TaxID=301880 RepID=A0ABQ5A3J3_9ASTR
MCDLFTMQIHNAGTSEVTILFSSGLGRESPRGDIGSVCRGYIDCGLFLFLLELGGISRAGGSLPKASLKIGDTNVISGIFAGLQTIYRKRTKDNTMYGFRGGAAGVMKGKYVKLTDEFVYLYRNQISVAIYASDVNHLTKRTRWTRKGKGKAHEGSYTDDDGLEHVITEHNKFLDKYFKSIEPKDEGSFGMVSLIAINGKPTFNVHILCDSDKEGWYCTSIGKIFSKTSDTLGDKWNTIASLQGLTNEDGEAMKDCYRKFIDMVQVYYETAKKPWYEVKPKEDVVLIVAVGDATVNDPTRQGQGDETRKEDAQKGTRQKHSVLESVGKQ